MSAFSTRFKYMNGLLGVVCLFMLAEAMVQKGTVMELYAWTARSDLAQWSAAAVCLVSGLNTMSCLIGS